MKKIIGFLLVGAFIFSGCSDDDMKINDDDLTNIPYQPEAVFIKKLKDFPEMKIPENNPLSKEGIQLGRMLFFDPILSSDSTLSCASCHLPNGAFTDNLPTSKGVTGQNGRRSSMAVMNMGYNENGFFWDGRANELEDQAKLPVEDQIELHENWDNVELKLRRHIDYPQRFRKAFGISSKKEITRDLAAAAIAQFERTLLVGENSRYYKVFVLGEDFGTEQENDGFLMFFDASRGRLPDGQCFHCHNTPFFTDNEYRNNGLTPVNDLNDFPDKGRGEVTGKKFDNGKFRTPTLWNIALTAPYMHDGRFKTLDEVLDHYASGGHYAENLDPLINDIKLNSEQKAAIKAFLLTLTDTVFTKNPDFQSPF